MLKLFDFKVGCMIVQYQLIVPPRYKVILLLQVVHYEILLVYFYPFVLFQYLFYNDSGFSSERIENGIVMKIRIKTAKSFGLNYLSPSISASGTHSSSQLREFT